MHTDKNKIFAILHTSLILKCYPYAEKQSKYYKQRDKCKTLLCTSLLLTSALKKYVKSNQSITNKETNVKLYYVRHV